MKKLVIAGVGFFCLLVAFISLSIYDLHLGERKILALLNGDARVEIVNFTTRFQQRRLQCTDVEVLRYLERIMMKRPYTTNDIWGHSYRGHFTFAGGGSVDVPMSVGTNGFALAVGKHPNPDELPTHFISLIEPVPDKVRQVFAFFDEPEQSAAGAVLIFDSGKPPRREHDESLVAK